MADFQPMSDIQTSEHVFWRYRYHRRKWRCLTGSRHGSGKEHGRRRNPRDRAGQVMTCRLCDSEEHFAAHCPLGNKGGPSTGRPSDLSPTFHVSEGRQAAGQPALTWSGFRRRRGRGRALGHTLPRAWNNSGDQAFMVAQGEDPLMASDPWARGRLEPGPSRQRVGSGSASSFSSWIPMQMAPPISIGP